VVSEKRAESGVNITWVTVTAVAIALVGAWAFMASRPRAVPPPQAITADAKAYVKNLKLSGVEMKATANYAGATVVEIVGSITNAGDRTLNRVELNCVFYDSAGLVVLRERVPIVRTTTKPGETRSFRLPFEGIPQSWNQSMPQLVIAHITFEG
jgi:hypothetical protein